MSNNVVLVPGTEKRGSVMHTHVSVLFLILFPIRLSQNTEQRNSYKGCIHDKCNEYQSDGVGGHEIKVLQFQWGGQGHFLGAVIY